MRPNHSLTRLSNRWVRLNLHLICKQQQYEAPMQQVNPEQIRHEAQFRIELQYLTHGLGRRHRM